MMVVTTPMMVVTDVGDAEEFLRRDGMSFREGTGGSRDFIALFGELSRGILWWQRGTRLWEVAGCC
jgi:hypothetical protein